MRVVILFAIIAVQWTFAVQENANSKGAIYPFTNASQSVGILGEFQKHVDHLMKQNQHMLTLFDFEGRIFPDEWASGLFSMVTFLLSDIGMCDPASEVAVGIEPMGKSCEKLTPDLIMNSNIRTTAKYLLNHDVLNCTNVKQLSMAYVTTITEVASEYFSKNHLRSKLAVMPLAFFAFVVKEKLFDPQNRSQSNAVARFFANEYSIESNLQKGKGQAVTTFYHSPLVFQHPYLNPSNTVCWLSSEPIVQFIRYFEEAVNHSPVLAELFKVSDFSPLDISRDAYYSSMYFLKSLDADDVPSLGDFMSNFIKDVKVLPRNAMNKQRSHFMAKYLWSEKFLNASNAQALGEKYAQIMEKMARSVMNINHPKSKLVVLSMGIRDFLLQTKTFEPKHALKLVFYYGNEWRCQLLLPFNN